MRARRSRVASATGVAVHAANILDRDGIAMVLDHRTRRLFPFIGRIHGERLSRAEGRKGRGQDRILDHRDRWTCMSSEHFGQLAWQFKRVSGSSGLKVQAAIAC
jgi:hypothetical protein